MRRPEAPQLRPPRPLVFLLAAVAIVGIAWALLVPPWQAPDEPAHFGYTQELAESFELPDTGPERTYSTELDLSVERTAADSAFAAPLARPEWRASVYERWRRDQKRLGDAERADGGGAGAGVANPARANPPLYYAWESLPYLAASGGDIFDRLYLMRVWSLLLLLVSVTATWLFVGEVLGRRPLLQLVGAGVAGLQPMASAISASVSPDALLIAACSTALWLGARVLLRGPTLGSALALGGAVAVAVLAKATGYAIVPAAAFALLAGLWRHRSERRPRPATAFAAGLAFALPVGAWLILAGLLDRRAVNELPGAGQRAELDPGGPLDYLWQFYLPKLPWQEPFPIIPPLPAYDHWVKTGWAAFGWLEVRFPEPVYVVLAVASVALVGAGVAALARRRRSGGLALLGFLALAALVLLAVLHWTEYRLITRAEESFTQGRYLLPLLPLLGLGAAGLVELVRPRLRTLAGGALLGGALCLQLFSLALVAGRFYA